MDKFSDHMGASSSSSRNMKLPSSASASKEESNMVLYKEIADKSAVSVGTGSLGKTSSGKSRDTILTQRDSKTAEPEHINQRKAKLKRFLRKGSTSTTSSIESEYRQLVDFSSFHAVAPSRDDAKYAMFDRTSVASAGVIEFSASFEEREMKRDRLEQEELRRRKKDKATTDFIVRPMRINLKPYQIEELKEAFNMLENGMELIEITHVPTIIRACGFEPDNEEVKEILDEIKPVNEGFLNLHELIKVFEAKLKRKDPIQEIRRAFKVFDLNSTGMITLDNLKEISKCVGEELHEEEMKEMINAADKTHSGGVTMENFVKLITRKEYFD